MKNSCFWGWILLLCISGIQGFSQAPSGPAVQWQKNYWTTGGVDWFYDIVVAKDGGGNPVGYMTCGFASSTTDAQFQDIVPPDCFSGVPTTAAGTDPDQFENATRHEGQIVGYFSFMDLYGREKFWKLTGGALELQSIIQTDNGEFVATGLLYGFQKFDNMMSPVEYLYNPTPLNPTNAVSCSLITADFIVSDPSVPHLRTIRFDIDGNIIWDNIYGIETTFDDDTYEKNDTYGYDVIESEDADEVIVVGFSHNVAMSEGKKIFILKLNANGEILWKASYGFSGYSNIEAHAIKRSGTDYIVTGEAVDGTTGERKLFVYKFSGSSAAPAAPVVNTNFKILDYTTTGHATNFDVEFSSGGDVLVPGLFNNPNFYGSGYNTGDGKVIRLEYNSTFDELDVIDVGRLTAFDMRADVYPTADDGFILLSTVSTWPHDPELDFADWRDNDYANLVPMAFYDPTPMENKPFTRDKCKYWRTDTYLARYDDLGALVWEKSFDAHNAQADYSACGTLLTDPDCLYEANPNVPATSEDHWNHDVKRQECMYEIMPAEGGGYMLVGNNSNNMDDSYAVRLWDDCDFTTGISYDALPGTAGVVTVDETISVNKKYKGVISVEKGATLTFTGGAVIEFASSFSNESDPTRIIVKPGGTLIVDNATLTSIQSCSNLWEGIQVWGDPTENNTDVDGSGDFYQGRALFFDATVENAYTAVTNWKPEDYNYRGGIIRADNTLFHNNWRTAAFRSYPFHNTSGFDLCTFEYDGMLNGHVRPEWHITMENTDGVNFRGCVFQNADPNTAIRKRDLGTGIYTHNAGFRVSPYTPLIGSPVPTEFHNLEYGIRAMHIGLGTTDNFTVDQAEFTHCYYGILSEGIDNAIITRNTFNLGFPNAPFTEGSFLESTQAIGMLAATGYSIEQNEFYTSMSSDNSYVNYGTWVVNNGGANNEIYNNLSDGIQVGHWAEGNNKFVDINTGEKRGVLYNCNNQDNMDIFDFLVLPDGNVTQFNGVCENQRDGTDAAGNIFSQTGGGEPDRQYRNDAELLNYFFYDNVSAQDEEPTLYSNINVISSSLINTCPNTYTGGGDVGTLDLGDISDIEGVFDDNEGGYTARLDTLQDSIDGGDTEALVLDVEIASTGAALYTLLMSYDPWLSEEVILAMLERDDILSAGQILDILAANPDACRNSRVLEIVNGMGFTLLELEALMGDLQATTDRTELEGALQGNRIEMERAANKLLRHYSLEETDTKNYTEILTWLESFGTLEAAYRIVDMHIEQGDDVSAEAALDDIPLNFDLTGDQSAEYSELQTIYEFTIDALSNNLDYALLDQEEILSALTPIAEEGQPRSKMLARNILRYLGEEYEDGPYLPAAPRQSNLSVTAQKPQPEAPKPHGLQIYPNPTGTSSTFSWQTAVSATQLLVVNVTGQIVQEYLVKGSSGNKEINTQSLPAGVYILKLALQDGSYEFTRWVVQK